MLTSECVADTPGFVKAVVGCVGIAASISIVLSFIVIARKVYEVIDAKPKNNVRSSEVGGPSSPSSPKPYTEVLAWIVIYITTMDIVVATSHLWGATQNYLNLATQNVSNSSDGLASGYQTVSCVTQAAVSVYSTHASFLWTIMLAAEVLVIVSFKSADSIHVKRCTGEVAMFVFGWFCWGAPLILVIALGASNSLGFNEGLDSGWCYIRVDHKSDSERIATFVFSYWLWVMLVIPALLVMSCAYVCCVCVRTPKFARTCAAYKTSITKNICAVSIFAGMRMTSFILGSIVLNELRNKTVGYHCSKAYAAGVVISSVFDTSQGGLNFIVFILIPFLPWVWQKIKTLRSNYTELS